MSPSPLRYGCSRMVLLLGPYAVKLPNRLYRWPAFCWGIIHNLNERSWWKAASGIFGESEEFQRHVRPLLCPVVWGPRWGFVLVMRRAEPLPASYDCPVFFEWLASRFEPHCACPAEKKIDSFGLLDGRIVAVDYG